MMGGLAARRFSWSLTDQGISSLTNFALASLVARNTAPEIFGTFSVAIVIYGASTGFLRAVVSEPLLVRYSGQERLTMRRAVRASTGCGLTIGIILGLGLLIVAQFLPTEFGRTIFSLGVCMPALMLQESWRYAFLADGKPARAAANDALWAALQLVGIAIALAHDIKRPGTLVLVWGGSAAGACMLASWQQRAIPSPNQSIHWIRSNSNVIPGYLGEFLAVRSTGQITLFAVGVFAGVRALGAFRAAQTVLGPINVFLTGIQIAALHEFSRDMKARSDKLRRYGMRLTLVTTGLAVFYCWLILIMPFELGSFFFGRTWELAVPLLVPLAIWKIALANGVAPLVGMRAMIAIKRSFRARIGLGISVLVFGPLGAILGGGRGAAVALGLATVLGVAGYWWQYHLALADLDGSCRLG